MSWLALALALTACGTGGTYTSFPDLGGDVNVALGSTGQQVTSLGGVNVGGTSVDVGGSMTMTSNVNGVATFHVTADLTSNPTLASWNTRIPSALKDSSGKLNTDVKFRITSEGIQDYLNKDGSQHTLINYSAQVGDVYALKKSDGTVITRTVTARSDQDDFPYGYLNIKTITVEQDSRIPGIKKIVYRANHRFGIVFVQVVADDGSTMSLMPAPKND